MITFNPDQLTTAEIELLEYTVTERMAPLRKTLELPPRVYTFADITGAFQSLRDGQSSGDAVPMGIVLRAVELLDLRKANPEATWDDTGTHNLVAEFAASNGDGDGDKAVVDPPVWPTPTT